MTAPLPPGSRPALVALTRGWTRLLARLVLRLSVEGRHHVPATGAVVVAGNHTGLLDGPLVYAFTPRPTALLAKAELYVGPLARALRWLGQVPVHRGTPDRAALRVGLAQLDQQGVLGVFPEGTRGAGTLEEVAHGVAYLLVRSGAPLVPVTVVGSAQAWPKGARLPRWRAPVRLVFGPPVHVTVDGDPRSRRTVAAAAEDVRLALVSHLRSSTGEVA